MGKVVVVGYRTWEEVVMGDIRWGKWWLWGIEDGEEVLMGDIRWGKWWL